MTLDIEFDAWCAFKLTDENDPILLSPLLDTDGDTGSVNLLLTEFPTHPYACTWEARVSEPWLKLLLNSPGQGEWVFFYQVDPNPGYSLRTATLTVADKIYFVQQAGQPPEIPDGVTATDGGFTDHIRISWYEAAGADSYNIYRKVTDSSYPFTLHGHSSTTFYDDTTAVENTVYEYEVAAVNSFGTSSTSSIDTGFTTLLIGCPAAPGSTSASDGIYNDKVIISWNPSAVAAWYTVYRALVSNEMAVFIQIGDADNEEYDDMTAQPGQFYLYKVKAVNMLGESDFSASDQGHATIALGLDIPIGLSASDGTFEDRVHMS